MKVEGEFSHPKSSPKPIVIGWTIEMAKRIGLASRDNWRNYPRAMLRARVISEGVRTVYPGIAVGIYTVEEVQDFAPERNITPTAGAADWLGWDSSFKDEYPNVTQIEIKGYGQGRRTLSGSPGNDFH